MAYLLDGKSLAKRIRTTLKTRVDTLTVKPGLAVILVGDDPASHTYVNIKQRACEEAGIRFEKMLFEADIPEEHLLEVIETLNHRSDINGILVQLPLPSQSANRIVAAIDPHKDVDGFHPHNLEALRKGEATLISALALGIVRLIALAIAELNASPATAVIVGSQLFSESLIPLLNERPLTTTVVSPEDPDLIKKTAAADLVIIAIGKPRFLTGDMIKPGAIVIDVGTTKIDGTLFGDVDRSTVEPIAGALSPVPGGAGPMTVAMLLLNVLKAQHLQHAAQAQRQAKSSVS